MHLYVMPLAGAGTDADPLRPKYAAQLAPFHWQMFDPTVGKLVLVGVQDVTAQADAALNARADVLPIPTDLDVGIGSHRLAAIEGALRTIRDALATIGG
jgi:hypothetical protein